MDKTNTSPSVQIGKRGVDMRGMRADFGGRVRRGVSGVRRVGVGCGEGGMFFCNEERESRFWRAGVSGCERGRERVWCGEGSRGLARGGSGNGGRKMKV